MEDPSTAAGPERTQAGATGRTVTLAAVFFVCFMAVPAGWMPTQAQADPYGDARAAQLRGDYATAARIYRSLADQGNIAALTQLGILYRIGRGVPRDYEEAATLLRRAAALGSSTAQYQMGDMFVRGIGVRQDLLEAARWYMRAAEQGHALAQYGLAVLYKFGGGVRKSNMRAGKWFGRSAAQGVAEAQYELGMLYFAGAGVGRNYVEAHKWLSLARSRASSSRTRTAAAEALGRLESRMSPQQIATAREQARTWRSVDNGGGGT